MTENSIYKFPKISTEGLGKAKLGTLSLFFLIGFVLTVKADVKNSTVVVGLGPGVTGILTNGTSKPCNSSNLDTCWSKLPPLEEPGIPSTAAAVEVACRAFDTGMSCVEDWAKQCLGKAAREKVKSSVHGAHETFTFLCRDAKFRAEFLRHAVCYKKISHLWDECAKGFIESLKQQDENREEPLTICCLRLQFFQCVAEVAHKHCSPSAEKFLTRLAESLLRSTLKNHVPVICTYVKVENCSESSGASPCPYPSTSIITSVPVGSLQYLYYSVVPRVVEPLRVLAQRILDYLLALDVVNFDGSNVIFDCYTSFKALVWQGWALHW